MAKREAMERRARPAIGPAPELPLEPAPEVAEPSLVEDVIVSVEALKEEHPEDETEIDRIAADLQALADRWAGGPEEPAPVAEAPGRLPIL